MTGATEPAAPVSGRHGAPSTDGKFRAGSTTKTFVATVVLQLVGEGKVDLDAPVDRYLPRFGLDRRITVRMLLQHTSGLFDYIGDRSPDGSTFEPGIPLVGKEGAANRFHHYRPDELVRLSLAKPARFEPGTQWRYSNTNYILAGLLVEQATGTPYATQVQRRILQPLRMHDTSLPGTRTTIPGDHAHAYQAYRDNGRLTTVDVTRQSATWAWAAGEIVTTTKDLDRFITALTTGKLLPPRLYAEMGRMTEAGSPTRQYGLGLARYQLGPDCVAVGHIGEIPGYKTYLLSTPDGSRRLEISTTQGALDYQDEAQQTKIERAEVKLVVTALCG
ncbi:serine hydrolase domain-containing protein [Amycolatopsis azurea]|uniref:D-alanyl-D-alanine carboxypeptidase n=1 Tax=Amycolatopsis azurea DSM 43854 TaxID=1238180 RepID=M2QPI3_9PSEU|nr:serine hydrolase domain-containing protein [Amycolatopsis azurea]EMD28591.1 D-alanyl-D-alanine carboxypeptidase [Amycolatopsis azurea DSM 43854]